MPQTRRVDAEGVAARLPVIPPLAGGSAWWTPGIRVRGTFPTNPAGPLGRSGSLEVRLATSAKEIRRAQRLRYKVFFEEMSAVPGPLARLSRRDTDAYDPICDHLVVLDHAVPRKPFRAPKPKVVGTYRLLRRDVADAHDGFYSAGEYDIEPLLAARPGARVLELGRSCVLQPYRTRKTVELLWQGLWAYVQAHDIDVMIGCASLPGTDPRRLASELSYLHHHARSPEAWRVRARADRFTRMDLVPRDLLDAKAAFKALPPLVKGYLRVGATFGEGAVVDLEFGTTDVFVVMPVAAIQGRYVDHFGPAANRRAA
ncbi:GNAT family N-acetyltransferase [uncultured Enterovirga sp.]|uniref:GNAT family N-acetyltransferase n=1 Tax=uncultured Enterovirga sp. TaxID=2026352 RepID=UPI0035C96F1D